MSKLLVFSMLLALSAHAQQATQPGKLSQGGYSIFHETMVDMPYTEVEAAAKRNAIVLWPMGVIEEHGPHLPLGTDIYNSYLRMKRAAQLLRAQGIEVIIAPPMYWGINEATGSFGGSFTVRPSTLKAIIEDTFLSFRKDGFQTVYIISGHGDHLHNYTIAEGVREARSTTGIRAFVAMNERMKQRLGLTGREPHVLVTGDEFAPPPGAQPSGPPRQMEIHAGAGETSIVWHFFPETVKADLIPTLKPTDYGPDDLAEWRKGWDNARTKTPLGYFGDPGSASQERGGAALERSAQVIADAIAEHVKNSAWNRQKR